jgi:hypothetical protein
MDAGFYLVRRPKCVVRHYGVAAVVPGRPAEVFELLPEGYRVTDLETFGAGRSVKFEDWRPLSEAPRIRSRLAALEPSWNLCAFNCEHAARWVLTGRRESRQIASWSRVAAALFGALVLLARR